MLETAIMIGGLVVFGLLRFALTRPRSPQHDALPEVTAPVHRTFTGIADGEWVTVIGQVRPTSEVIAATLSGQRCVACVARAKAWHSKKIPHLIGEVRQTTSSPFVLEVTDGELKVEGEVELTYPTRVIAVSAERGRAFLAAHKLERYLDSTEFEEAIMVAGERVAVTGVIVRDHAAEGGYRETPERVRLMAPRRAKVSVARAPNGS